MGELHITIRGKGLASLRKSRARGSPDEIAVIGVAGE